MSKVSCKLEDLIIYISRGITPKYTEKSDNSCIVLNQKCIRDFSINFNPSRKNDILLKKISDEKFIEQYDVLINSTGVGTLGRVAQFLDNAPNSITVDSHITIVRPNSNKIHPLFFGYLLKSKQNEIESFAQGTTGQTELSRDDLKNMVVEFTNNKELQIKHSEFLLNIDDKIQLNTQTNQTLEAIAQAIFKSWFMDFDPVRAKAQAISDGKTSDEANLSAMAVISGKAVEDLSQTEYQELWEIADAFPGELVENAEFGEVPKGWEVRKVGEIANFIKGKKPKQTSNFQENEMLPHILVASLSGKYGEFAPIETAVICQNKETLILMDGSGSGKVSIGHNGVVGSTLAKLNLNNEKYWAIIYLLLKSKELDIQQHTTGTSIPHTDKTRVLNYDLIIPCDVILNWFNGYFENTLYLILTNRNKSLFLEKARDELLPKLLSGEIEL